MNSSLEADGEHREQLFSDDFTITGPALMNL
jgi:hypothetical protein